MIEVNGLTKRYGKHLAVNDISFSVKAGEILGFLGPNGAGKSTTMNIITGYLSPTEGTASIAGIDVMENPIGAKKHIGFLPEHPPLYLDMKVREYLGFVYDLKKVGGSLPKVTHIEDICRQVRIDDVINRPIRNLSKGYRQRVGIAQAMVGNPPVLILDEPTVGLDPKQIIEIRNLIRHLGRKHTVILSSHILSEVQAVCERIIVINKGRIVADGTTAQLSATLSGDNSLAARIIGPQDDVLKLLREIPGVKNASHRGAREAGSYEYVIEPKGETDVRRELFERLAERGWPVIMLKSNELTLEEIFLKLTDESYMRTKMAALKTKPKPGKKPKPDNTEQTAITDTNDEGDDK